MSQSCAYCGKSISPPKRVYCSRKCLNKNGVRAWRRRIKRRAVDYKGGACQQCGYNRCVAAMVFHHTGGKVFRIGDGKGRSWESIQCELDKCELLCLICHAELHHPFSGGHEPGELERDHLLWLNADTPSPPRRRMLCLDCGKPVSPKAIRCKSCASKRRPTKVRWPETKKLGKMVKDVGYEAVGRQLGVSGNAVKKRIKNH